MMNEHETTRGSNGTTRIKEVRRKQWKEKYLEGTYTAVDYRNTILLTIGHENIYSVFAPALFPSPDNLARP